MISVIETSKYDAEWNNQKYIACRLTEKRENWILSNQKRLQLHVTKQKNKFEDDLPF